MTAPVLTNFVSYANAADSGAPTTWNVARTLGTPFTGTINRLLVFIADSRSVAAMVAAPTGWTKLSPEIGNAPDSIAVYARIAAGGDTGCPIAGGCTDWAVFEYAVGPTLADITVTAFTAQGPASTWASPTVTPTAGDAVAILSAIMGHDDTWLGTGAPGSGYTVRGDFGQRGNHPHTYFMSRDVALAAGSYSPTVVVSATIGGTSHVYDALSIVITGGPTLPTPGVWIDVAGDGFDDGSTVGSDYGFLARRYPEAATTGISDNITADVKQLMWNRPGDPNHTGSAPPDSLTIIVNNSTGKYTPTNPASPFYNLLRASRPVWVGINENGTLVYDAAQTVRGLWAGRVNKIVPMPQLGFTEGPDAQIICDGIMVPWRKRKALVEFAADRTVDEFRAAILESLGVTSANYDLASEPYALPYSGLINVKTGTMNPPIRAVSAGRGGAMPIGTVDPAIDQARLRPKSYPDGLGLLEDLCRITGTRHAIVPADNKEDWFAYTTYPRSHKLGSAADAAWVAADLHGMNGYEVSADGVVNMQDAAYTPVVVDSQPRVVWTYSDVPISVTPGHSIDINVEFGDYVFDPVVITNYATAFAPVIVRSTNYGDGMLLKISVGAVSGQVTQLYITGRRVARQDTQVYVKKDAASANDTTGYGERSGNTIQSDFLQSSGQAQGIVDFLVYKFANPLAKPSAILRNNTAVTAPRKPYDVVTLTFAPIHITARRFEIVGRSGQITLATDATIKAIEETVALQETPNPSALSLFRIGISALGGSDIIGP